MTAEARPTVDDLAARLRAELKEGTGASRPPASTYRLQLRPGFGFVEAAQVVPYLRALGVDAVYLSPILAAQPGSTHGYDVVDHGRINPDLGGEAGHEALCRVLADHGMGQIVDFVPNHMGIGRHNAWWMDLLENGPSSVHAGAFDVDWHPHKEELEHKVLLPVLGDQYGAVLERGELRLRREGGSFYVEYFDQRFPVAPRSIPALLRYGLETLRAELGAGDVHLQELESVASALEKLAPREQPAPERVEERAREKEVAKRRLAALFEVSPRLVEHVDRNVARFNGAPGRRGGRWRAGR